MLHMVGEHIMFLADGIERAVQAVQNGAQNVRNLVHLAQYFLLDDGDTSSSSEDEQEDNILMWHEFIPANRHPVVRIHGYLEHTISEYTAEQFQEHFRLSIHAYNVLERQITPLLLGEGQGYGMRRYPLDVCHQLLPVLWLLATPDSYRSLGDRVDQGKSTFSRSFMKIVLAINRIADRVIVWPSQEQRQVIKQGFENIAGLPNLIGAVDGTYIKIKAPHENPQAYRTRKSCYAITAQRISDNNVRFLDVFVGYPGSVHDARIFRNSHTNIDVSLNKNEYFDDNEYIIGDKAYPVKSWCIPLYINRGNLTPAQRYFNTMLSRHRQVIERAWCLLLGRFRRLQYLDMNRDDMIPATVLACCVLHNICLDHAPLLLHEYEEKGRAVLVNEDNDNVNAQFLQWT